MVSSVNMGRQLVSTIWNTFLCCRMEYASVKTVVEVWSVAIDIPVTLIACSRMKKENQYMFSS